MTHIHSKSLAATVALTATILASAPAWAQSRPFPTSGHYPHGFLPSSVTTAVVQSSYANWKAKYLLDDCGNGDYRVDNATGDASTFSEGQGYGMVLTAYMGDKTAFDGLWSFAQKNYNQQGLMGWHVTCSGATTSDGGSGSATDGDTDIAFGLVVAASQWGGTYAQQAKTYLTTLKNVDFTTCSPSGRNIPTFGNWQGNSACTASGGGSDTSYWMPAYYRVFQSLTGDSFWGKAADDVVDLYNLAADPTTGIIVNAVDQDGAAVSGQTYDYNSCRIPWRASLDYLWYGTPGAQQAVTKITNWANTVGIQSVVDGYNANGTPTGQYTGINAFVGGFTAGAMGDSQSLVDSFSSYFVTIDNDNGTYFGSSLRTLYLLQLSGNQWNPIGASASGDAGASGDGGGSSSGSSSGSSGGSSSGSSSGATGGSSGGSSGGLSAGDAGTQQGEGDDGALPDNEGGLAAGATPGNTGPASSGCSTSVGPTSAGVGFGLASMLGLLVVRRRKRVAA